MNKKIISILLLLLVSYLLFSKDDLYEGFLWAHSGNANATTDELHVIMGGLIREPRNIAREN